MGKTSLSPSLRTRTNAEAAAAAAAAPGAQPTDFGVVQAASHQARLGPERPSRTGVTAEAAASRGEIIDVRQSWLALSLSESHLKFLGTLLDR